ncbi:MAG: hypothetical protein M5R36_11195 [Deltaproteobacteria bacterium]|nr:hypothetical protein [Deltaproteobacteria bacterium]
MKKVFSVLLVASLAMALSVAVAFACDGDKMAKSGETKTAKGGCPYKDGMKAAAPTGYDQPLALGDKFACCGCEGATEAVVTDKTIHVEKDGKHYYFNHKECADKFGAAANTTA